MARSWVIDSRGLATKVKNAVLPTAHQIKDCGANRECPKCHYIIDNSDICHEWPGLPAGVKFDPSDAELLEHLAAKCGVGNSESHKFIDEFIPTLEGDEGICYTHPENLPGAKKDGSTVHFFYRTTNAYATGQRKRRKIHIENSLINEQVRWHKTGKTKTVMDNGIQKGCKKIMVLYRTSKRGSKPDKSKWVMHQYHLGSDEDEKEGQYVVSKIFYQQHKQVDNNDTSIKIEQSDNHDALLTTEQSDKHNAYDGSPSILDYDIGTSRTSPRTPKIVAPDPPRPGETPSFDDATDDYSMQPSFQEMGFVKEALNSSSSDAQVKDKTEHNTWLAGESQAADVNGVDELLLCNEIIDSSILSGDFGLDGGPFGGLTRNTNDVPQVVGSSACGIAELENLELDSPPDFQLGDLNFGSQDSVFSWLDKL
ncbi:SUPPRESSOR OF GAMMA RESPONSE 1-like [Coffea arabica]|uniref:SUPPRESSOR OF GAMMA RESPONSE 1-like n=1 Tax=Coffea arabica TaxID=13443 RepID=A0ABM4V548_COFAR